MAYSFVSALPLKKLRATVLPSVYGNPCRKCSEIFARVSYSTDGGKTYKPLVSQEGGPECEWSPKIRPRYARAAFPGKTTSLILLFELGHGHEALFHAIGNPIYRMRFEADLDASTLSAPALDRPPRSLTLQKPRGAGVHGVFSRRSSTHK